MNNWLKTIAPLIIASAVWLSPVMNGIVSAQNREADYALAAGFYSRGQWEQAYSSFRRIMDDHPNTDEAAAARFFASEALMEQDKFGEAFQGYQTFLRMYPKHAFVPRTTFRMGEAAYRAKRYEVAARLLEEFVKYNPKHDLNEFALPYLGQIRLKWDEPQLAQRAFETSLRMFPSSTLSDRSRLGLAKSLQRLGQDKEAKRFYDYLATQLDKEIAAESRLQLGIMSFTDNNYDEAEELLVEAEKMLTSESSKAQAIYWMARIQNSLQNPTEALPLLEKVIQSDAEPNVKSAAMFDAAVVASKLGQNEKALKWLGDIRVLHKSSKLVDDALRMEIELWQQAGNEQKVKSLIAKFRKLHRTSPMITSVLEAEGRHHYSEGAFEEVIATFAMLLDEHPQAPEQKIATWRYMKALGYLGQKRFKKAERELAQIDGLVLPNELPPLIAIANASARFGQQKFAEAAPHFTAYLKLQPHGNESRLAKTQLVVCLSEAKKWSEAASVLAELEHEHGLDPKLLQTTQFVAERAYKLGDFSQAETLFKMLAKEGNPKEFVARGLSGLAWIKMESNDSEAAYAVFDRLINECPDSKFAGEAAMARGKFLEQKADFLQAAQMYGLVIRRFDKTPMANVARLRRAYSLQKVGGNVNLVEARTLINEYLQSENPKLPGEALFQLAWVHVDLGDEATANQMFAELVEKHPTCKYLPDAAYRLIQNHVANNSLDQAQPLIKDLLKRENVPSEVTTRILFLSGQIAAGKKNWKRVSETMRQLLERDADQELTDKAQYWLAESLFQQNEFAAALENFRMLLPKMASGQDKLAPWILLRCAQCSGHLNDWIEGSRLAKQGKSQFPNFEADYEFDYVLGRGLEDEGRLSDARKVYRKVVRSKNGKSSETAAISQWRIGETYFHQEEYITAINAYYKVDSLYAYPKWRSAALMQAGKCQEHLKNNMHAIKLYKQLLEKYPECELAVDAKQRLSKLVDGNELESAVSTEDRSPQSTTSVFESTNFEPKESSQFKPVPRLETKLQQPVLQQPSLKQPEFNRPQTNPVLPVATKANEFNQNQFRPEQFGPSQFSPVKLESAELDSEVVEPVLNAPEPAEFVSENEFVPLSTTKKRR